MLDALGWEGGSCPGTRPAGPTGFQGIKAGDGGVKMPAVMPWLDGTRGTLRRGWVMEYPDQGAEALCGKVAKSLYKRPGISLKSKLPTREKEETKLEKVEKGEKVEGFSKHPLLFVIHGYILWT